MINATVWKAELCISCIFAVSEVDDLLTLILCFGEIVLWFILAQTFSIPCARFKCTHL
uniref:Uncharacterized protein n=1 Tax=Anguilla anguilla TaxID=7936 RepID=A0A0E9Q3Y0_ANGAN